MKDYIIYTDASADADSDFLNANGVKTVPMEYNENLFAIFFIAFVLYVL